MERKDWFNVLYIGLCAMVAIFAGVFVLSRHSTSSTIFLGDKGSLGDAVNGLSAPIISFFSAILIYVTFKEQNKANKMQVEANRILQSQWRFDTSLKLFDSIRNRYENISIEVMSKGLIKNKIKYSGTDALSIIPNAGDVIISDFYLAVKEFDEVLTEWEYLIKSIIENKFYDELFNFKMLNYYNTNLSHGITVFNETVTNKPSNTTIKLLITTKSLDNRINELKKVLLDNLIAQRKQDNNSAKPPEQ